jgi:phosphoribosylamine--glycine ligase
MNILILGSGGREHALAWAVKQNPKCDRLIVAPGNAGIAMLAECADIDILDGAAVVTFCEENAIDFVIVGPEAPLAAGVADAARAAGLLTFGPSAAAARLEASKAFTKDICDACGPDRRLRPLHRSRPGPRLCDRKGRPHRRQGRWSGRREGRRRRADACRALAAIDDMFGGSLGAAGAEVVIEEFMQGEEASFFILTDGTTALPIGTAQDHKRVGDGDTGPNTGGMGAYSPAPVLTEAKSSNRRWTRSSCPPSARWPGAAHPIRGCFTRA